MSSWTCSRSPNKPITAGRYGNLDYDRPLDPPLEKEEAVIAEQFLKAAGKR
jgi:hypothetical protein